MADLLPCPFCGSQGWLHSDGGIFSSGPAHRIECEGACHAMTCYWHTADEAYAAWNRRAQAAPSEPLPEDAEPLAAALHVEHSTADGLEGATKRWLRVARLVLADRQRAVAQAVQAEREACVKICDREGTWSASFLIRARGVAQEES